MEVFMKYLSDSIIQYLDLPQTNYAIQIDGAWGTGKTYYFKNTVIPKIQEHKVKGHEEKSWRVCYISLNGISTVEEVSENVFLQIAGTTSQLAFQGMKLLGRYGGNLSSLIPLPERLVESAFEKLGDGIASKIQEDKMDALNDIVLCFDDLERADDKLSLKQIFGFINSNFIEHNNVKVIFISHEKEIACEDYDTIKEKVIGRTLKFVQTKNDIFEKIVKSIFGNRELFMKFYEEEKPNLELSMSILFEDVNLRTLRFMLDSFSILQEKASSLCENDEERNELSKALFLNTLIISKEYKEGKFKEIGQLENIHNKTYIYSMADEESYEKLFLKKYNKINPYIDKNIYYFKFISKYILTGVIEEEFENEIINYLNSKVRPKEIKKENSVAVLSDFMVYEDEELKSAQENVLKTISTGDYLVGDYFNIYNAFKVLETKKLIFVEEDYLEIIETGFQEALEKWIPKGQFDFYRYRIDENDPKAAMMVTKIKDKNAKVLTDQKKENVQRWLQALSTDSVETELYKAIEYEENFFQICIDIQLHKNIHTCNNTCITYLGSFLNQKYLRVSNAGAFLIDTELEYINEFVESLEEILSNEELQRTRKYVLESFKNLLIEVKVHLIATSNK